MTIARACLCGSSDADLVHRGVRHDTNATVWRCSACGLVYTWPRPTEAELARYYAESYRGEYGAVPPEVLRSNGAADTVARTERLASLLDSSAALLDVGAGAGGFVEAVSDAVASVTAVEPDAESRDHIREKFSATTVATLADLPAEERFDLITAFHVLEHVPDPRAFLQKLARLLQPGGSIAVEVPNIDDALVSVYPGSVYPSFYYQKAHLFYFSAQTLARLADDAGLAGRVEFVQRYGLRNHLHWLAAGEPGGDDLYSHVVLESADAAYRRSLVDSGRADTLWLVANVADPAA